MKTSAALCPPKPKLLESTASTRAGRAVRGDVVEAELVVGVVRG